MTRDEKKQERYAEQRRRHREAYWQRKPHMPTNGILLGIFGGIIMWSIILSIIYAIENWAEIIHFLN